MQGSRCSRPTLCIRNFFVGLAITAAVAAAVSCTGDSPSLFLGTPGGAPAATRGAIRGFVFARGAVPEIVIGSVAAAPAGFAPLTGAMALVTDSGASAITDATGLFTIGNIPAGEHTLRISPTTGTPRDMPITVIGSATVDLGAPPVSRDQAAASVKTAVGAVASLNAALIMAPREPLPSGVVVSPALGDASGQPDPALDAHVASPSWFFFVDSRVGKRFQHPVTYYFVDAVSGAVTSRDETSWPLINGLNHYAMLESNFTSTDLVQAPVASASRAVAFPTTTQPWPQTPSRDHVANCASAKVYSLFIQGDARDDFGADFAAIPSVLGPTALGQSGDSKTYMPLAAGSVNASQQITAEFNALCAETTPCDTLLVYFTSHGTQSGKLVVAGGTAANGSAIGNSYIAPETFFDFSKCAACHIIVIMDACYSEVAAQHLATAVRPLTGKKVTIIAASSSTETAGGNTATYSQSQHTYHGGEFTSKFLVAFQAVAHSQGHVGIDDLKGIVDTTAGVMVQDQHPVVFRRQLQPGETCGTLATVTSGPISASHTVGVTACPEPIGTIDLNNVSSGTLHFQVTSTNPVFEVLNAIGSLEAGGSTTLNVQFNCGQQPPQTGTISIMVTNAAGATQTLSVPINLMRGGG